MNSDDTVAKWASGVCMRPADNPPDISTSGRAGVLDMFSCRNADSVDGGCDDSMPEVAADLIDLVGSYWYVAPKATTAFRNRLNGEPKEVVRQTVWWIQRIEKRFLFGYSWDLVSDTENVRVRRLTLSIAPNNAVCVCVYGDPKSPANGTGTFDGRKFIVNTIDGDLVHWANMSRASNLARTLPGCLVSIDELRQLYAVPRAAVVHVDESSWLVCSGPCAQSLRSAHRCHKGDVCTRHFDEDHGVDLTDA